MSWKGSLLPLDRSQHVHLDLRHGRPKAAFQSTDQIPQCSMRFWMFVKKEELALLRVFLKSTFLLNTSRADAILIETKIRCCIGNNLIGFFSMKVLFGALAFLSLAACSLDSTLSVNQSMEVRASRAYAGPSQFPPSRFAGYGMLVFPNSPKRDPARFQMFCQAFLASFLSSNELVHAGVPTPEQMVTVMPVSSNTLSLQLEAVSDAEACKIAIEEYGLAQAQNALKKAEAAASLTDGLEALGGRGPFLLAWSPGRTFGSRDALVLAADLSNTSTPEQALSDMQTWRRDIEMNSDQWREGWNLEGIRLIAQRWVDRRGDAILKLIGDWS